MFKVLIFNFYINVNFQNKLSPDMGEGKKGRFEMFPILPFLRRRLIILIKLVFFEMQTKLSLESHSNKSTYEIYVKIGKLSNNDVY